MEWDDHGQPVLVGDQQWHELPESPVIRVQPDTPPSSTPTRGEQEDHEAQR
jgi:hypothetical protein